LLGIQPSLVFLPKRIVEEVIGFGFGLARRKRRKLAKVKMKRAVKGTMEVKKISLHDLIELGHKVSVDLFIRSQDPEIYLAEAAVRGERYVVTTDHGQRLMTRSLGAIKRALVGVPYRTATLVHQSSYDEMIGNPVAGQDLALEMPLKI